MATCHAPGVGSYVQIGARKQQPLALRLVTELQETDAYTAEDAVGI